MPVPLVVVVYVTVSPVVYVETPVVYVVAPVYTGALVVWVVVAGTV